jgi:hypothetical protein
MTIVMNRRGIRKTSLPIASPVTGAAIALYNITPGRTAILRKLTYLNACGAASDLSIGQGLAGAFVNRIPPIHTLNGLGDVFAETELPALEFQYTVALPAITFVSTVAGITVVIEVEEIG